MPILVNPGELRQQLHRMNPRRLKEMYDHLDRYPQEIYKPYRDLVTKEWNQREEWAKEKEQPTEVPPTEDQS